jgi:hypothetical protein
MSEGREPIGEDETTHPAGEIRLPVRTRIGARVAVLAGLTLVATTIVIDPGNTETSRILGIG